MNHSTAWEVTGEGQQGKGLKAMALLPVPSHFLPHKRLASRGAHVQRFEPKQ